MTEPSPVLSTKLTPSRSMTTFGGPSFTAAVTASLREGAPATSRRPEGASTVTPASVCRAWTSRLIGGKPTARGSVLAPFSFESSEPGNYTSGGVCLRQLAPDPDRRRRGGLGQGHAADAEKPRLRVRRRVLWRGRARSDRRQGVRPGPARRAAA